MGVTVIKHGLYGTTEYKIYRGMVQRCYDKNAPDYPRYGGRGIKICKRWRKGEAGLYGVECFLEDMGKRPSSKYSIDRLDNDKGYSKNNCEWKTRKQQQRNRCISKKILYKGKMVSIYSLVEKFGSKVSAETVYCRIQKGMSLKEALKLEASNKITKVKYKGKILAIDNAIKLSGSTVSKEGVIKRLKRGWDVNDALNTPPRSGKWTT